MPLKKHSNPMDQETLRHMTPDDARERLVAGNNRFLKRLDGEYEEERDLAKFVHETSEHGQFPFAIVLSCVDSRMPTETLFDQSIGDIFNARIAGNFVNEDILGSMEFACGRVDAAKEPIGAKLILVLGHTSCGAVGGAAQAVHPKCFGGADEGEPAPENLVQMLGKIIPAVRVTPLKLENGRKCTDEEWQKNFVNRCAEENVKLTIQDILQRSDALFKLNNNGAIKIQGAMYNVSNGKVEFLPKQPTV